MTSGAPSTTSGAPCDGHAIACSNRQAADRLHRDLHRPHHVVQFVHRTEALDHAAFVVADVMNDEVDAQAFHPARVRDPVVGAQVVAHHLDRRNRGRRRRRGGSSPRARVPSPRPGSRRPSPSSRLRGSRRPSSSGRRRSGDPESVARSPSTARSPSASISGVPASSQSTPASTAIAAVSSASSSEVRSSEIWTIGNVSESRFMRA